MFMKTTVVDTPPDGVQKDFSHLNTIEQEERKIIRKYFAESLQPAELKGFITKKTLAD